MKYLVIIPFVLIVIGMIWVAMKPLDEILDALTGDEEPLNSSDADPPVPPFVDKP